ncbi:D-tyrosyl-tRNA(Tyr) deacylase [Puniceicoccales bacterium CK1056]|uniref:D-aminoacyl-tRNA deacylase n=1 Tax=Oceanipulchritudo coccoides TaxID=2706888 RepID=A0A6B2M562_9BACT|nr:D-aminoacyl-tRNA deacylase [Oceanipulchritudo coccoides]NDV63526.1 D-tyrosyl-tRNA(Tyr) deacylase [Oceanipulchritudo coccoides]
MRAVLQRVKKSVVKVEGKSVGSIGKGLLVFLGIERIDTNSDLEWLVDKLPRVRCFEDDAGRMNRNLEETGGEVMVISQFTLFGSLRKGTRPSFNRAADPEQAIPLYEEFVERLSTTLGKPVATGIFGAEMEISAVNDGPVTLVIDTKNRDF